MDVSEVLRWAKALDLEVNSSVALSKSSHFNPMDENESSHSHIKTPFSLDTSPIYITTLWTVSHTRNSLTIKYFLSNLYEVNT